MADSNNNPYTAAAIRKVQMPVADTGAAERVQAGQMMRLQAAAGAPQAGAATSQQLREAGTSAAQQAAGEDVQAAAGRIKQAVDAFAPAAQGAIAQKSSEAEAAQADRAVGLGEVQLAAEKAEATLGSTLKHQLVDARTQFAYDEAGRAVLNSTQLADWAVTNARSKEDLENKAQEIQHVTQRKQQILQQMQTKAMQMLDERTREAVQAGNHELAKQLMDYKVQIEQGFVKSQAEFANKFAKNTAIGTLIGAGIGSIGGVTGAKIGAAVGGGLAGLGTSQGKI